MSKQRAPMEFRATGADYLGFLFLRLLLVAVTFGLYGFWLAGDARAWKARHTYVHGQPLAYRSSVGDFALNWIVKTALFFLTFGLYLPWSKVNGERFAWHHTRVADGRNCRFDGTGAGFVGVFLVGMLIRVFTLGFGASWAKANAVRWQRQHLRIGGERVVFKGTGGQVFLRNLVGRILTLFTLGLYYPWWVVQEERWIASNSWVALGEDTSPVPLDPIEATMARFASDRRTWYAVGAATALAVAMVVVTSVIGAVASFASSLSVPEPVAAFTASRPSPEDPASEESVAEAPPPAEGAELWSFSARHRVIVRPALAGGRVIFGAMDGYTYAVDARTGAQAWEARRVTVEGSPVVAERRAIVGGSGWITAFEVADGKIAWQHKVRGSASAPVRAKDLVLAQTEDDDLVALDLATGQERWSFDTGYYTPREEIYNPVPGPVVAGTWAFVGGAGVAWALEAATGTVRWRSDLGSAVKTTPAVADGRVYFGTADGVLHALDGATGSAVWTFDLGEAAAGDPLVRGGVVYVGARDGRFHALDAGDGHLLWSFKTGGSVRAAAAAGGGQVFVPSWDGSLYALDARTGKLRWSFATGGRPAHGLVAKGHLIASPLLADGRLYVGSEDYHLYALATTASPDPEPAHGLPDVPPAPALMGGVETTSATSEFREKNGTVESAAHLFDGDFATPWCEAAAGLGLGEAVRVRLASPRTIAAIEVVNGFGRAKDLRANAQVSVLGLRSAGVATSVELPKEDTPGFRRVALATPLAAHDLELLVEGAHPGRKYEDTCLSELRFLDARDVRIDTLRETAATRVLTTEDLAGLGPDDLRLLRNSVFAGHGRRFDDPALAAYFAGRLWYAPTDTPGPLGEAETRSLDLVKALEEGGPVPEPAPTPVAEAPPAPVAEGAPADAAPPVDAAPAEP